MQQRKILGIKRAVLAVNLMHPIEQNKYVRQKQEQESNQNETMEQCCTKWEKFVCGEIPYIKYRPDQKRNGRSCLDQIIL